MAGWPIPNGLWTDQFVIVKDNGENAGNIAYLSTHYYDTPFVGWMVSLIPPPYLVEATQLSE